MFLVEVSGRMETLRRILEESENELLVIQDPTGEGVLKTSCCLSFAPDVAFLEYIPKTTILPKEKTTRWVSLNLLVATQRDVFIARLNELLREKEKVLNAPILVTRIIKKGDGYSITNKYHIIDGHHRAVMAALLKKKKVLVNEIPYPESFKTEE